MPMSHVPSSLHHIVLMQMEAYKRKEASEIAVGVRVAQDRQMKQPHMWGNWVNERISKHFFIRLIMDFWAYVQLALCSRSQKSRTQQPLQNFYHLPPKSIYFARVARGSPGRRRTRQINIHSKSVRNPFPTKLCGIHAHSVRVEQVEYLATASLSTQGLVVSLVKKCH